LEMPGLSLDGGDCVERLAGPDMPAQCSHCDKLLEYSVIRHTEGWMWGCYACPEHRHEVWVDIYPKKEPGTSQDTFNMWPQYADRAKRIPMASSHQLLRHQFIVNEDEIQDELERKRREAPLLFKLTPNGLEPLRFGVASYRFHKFLSRLKPRRFRANVKYA